MWKQVESVQELKWLKWITWKCFQISSIDSNREKTRSRVKVIRERSSNSAFKWLRWSATRKLRSVLTVSWTTVLVAIGRFYWKVSNGQFLLVGFHWTASIGWRLFSGVYWTASIGINWTPSNGRLPLASIWLYWTLQIDDHKGSTCASSQISQLIAYCFFATSTTEYCSTTIWSGH